MRIHSGMTRILCPGIQMVVEMKGCSIQMEVAMVQAGIQIVVIDIEVEYSNRGICECSGIQIVVEKTLGIQMGVL